MVLNGLWRGLGRCAEELGEVVHRAWTLARVDSLESDLLNETGYERGLSRDVRKNYSQLQACEHAV